MVGADVVEVAPAYDGPGEATALTAAQVGYEILTSWVGKSLADIEKLDQGAHKNAGGNDDETKRDEL